MQTRCFILHSLTYKTRKHMSRILTFLAAFLLTSSIMMAQIQLPAPSPTAVLKQTAGLTDIEIVYASPAVNGRTVYGDLVPYGEMWRAGANNPTTISFSKEVTIDGKKVAAGTYAIYVTPMQGSGWTVTLNSDPNAQAWGRDAAKDVVSMKGDVKDVAHHERLMYSITDFNDSRATVSLTWEKKQVSFGVTLHTAEQAMANIKRANTNGWRDYFTAARYLVSTGENLDVALENINTSLALNENWFNTWVKAQVLSKQGSHAEAYAHAEKAMELGNKNPDSFWYKADVEAALKNWKKK